MTGLIFAWILAVLACLGAPLVVFVLGRSAKKKVDARESIKSASYSPFARVSSIDKIEGVSAGTIRKDLKALGEYVDCIRTYSVSGFQSLIPAIANERGMMVVLGVWLTDDLAENSKEIDTAIALVSRYPNIKKIVVGSETLFRHQLELWQLRKYIDYVKNAVDIPVTTAELWHTWMDNPKLAENVDEITVHVLPFWEGLDCTESVSYILDVLNVLSKQFPGRKIYLGEIGWPSKGQSFNSMPCDPYQQTEHIRTLVKILNERGVDYNVIEAFDQSWKIGEGTVGRHWGLLNKAGKPKFILGSCNTVPVESWSMLIFNFYRTLLGKILVCLALGLLLVISACSVWSAVEDYPNVLRVGAVICWVTWLSLTIALGLHETVERFLMRRQRQPTVVADGFNPSVQKVAVHLACCNEPPQMVIDTLKRLARLQHGDYKVYVVDNNTTDESLWKPVEACCVQLGERFQFWHVENLSGFKAGALNFLLGKTPVEVDVIAVIDSDYLVESDWLKLLYFFGDPEMAVIQAPQNYMKVESLFDRLCYYEYKSFFNTGMLIRDAFNSIILHGTMTLIKADVLKRLRWAEWCICEDAELGLRILMEKKKMMYVPVSYGRGVLPDRFDDYKRQRARWVVGAVQILDRHFDELLTLRGGLTWQQKYQFIIGWSQWLSKPLSLFVTLSLILWSIAVLCSVTYHPGYPLLVSVSLICAFLVTVLIQVRLYVAHSPDGHYNSWLSILASQALDYTVAIAVLHALSQSKAVFIITPKMGSGARVRNYPMDCMGEMFLFVLLVGLSIGIAWSDSNLNGEVWWSALLIIRSIPYGLAVAMSLISRNHIHAPRRLSR